MRRAAPLIFTMAAITLLAGTAATAHVSVGRTTLSIQIRGDRVEVGETVSITGRLGGKRSCRPGQQIDLIRPGSGVVATTTTDADGAYRFRIVATEDEVLQARFSGSVSGIHPHSHVCSASTSRTLRMDVLGAGGGNDVRDGGGTTAVNGGSSALTGRDVTPFAAIGAGLLMLGVLAALVGRQRKASRNPVAP